MKLSLLVALFAGLAAPIAARAFVPAPAAAPADAAPPAVRAGAAEVDITPESPIRLSGYGARTTSSEGVEQRIHARALAIEDAEKVLTVLLSVDSIGVPESVRERVIGEIRGRLGIYHVRLSLSSTHSHCTPQPAGALINLFVMTPEETETVDRYTDFLSSQLVKAVEGALKSLRPARLSWGKGTAGFAANRRTPGGPVDQELGVLAALEPGGKPIAIVFNYACHATTLGGEFNRACGDWPGYAADYVQEAHPGAIALPLIGCGADANPSPRGKLEDAKRHGREISGAIDAVLKDRLQPLPAKIDAQLEYVNLRFAKLPTEKELKSRLEKAPDHIRRHARHQLDRIAREGKLPATLKYPVQVFNFGDALTMVLLSGEVVVDYAIRLKKEIPGRNLWITSYSNDVPCYIASRRVLGEGGYEADDSMYWYDQPTRLDPSVEDTIVDKVKELVEGSSGGAAMRRVKPPPAVAPREALATFRLAEGFGIELAAAEPEVTDPVAISFDERGRLFAAEMRDYPLGPGEGKPFDGRIRLLEDADLDGYYERSSIFAENVPYPNGICCARGGVYVTCAPDLLFLKDTDGDGRAEVRRQVYTGFNLGNSQHLLNTLKLGLDNWIYLNGGDSADLRSPADPKIPRLKISGVSFRFDPRTLAIEPTTGYQGGYGIAFDRHGERFVCENQVHAMHVVLPREYLGRNPDLRIDETVNAIYDHGRTVYPASKPIERFNDPWDAGTFSSACGVHIYSGDQFPEPYRGSHFACEPVSNLVHRDVLVPSGATFVARRGEADSEFLASTDHWFRPVSCDTGPDGALYVVDMYREVIEHPQWIPEHMQKLFDLRSGMDRGRIYRVFHRAPPERKKVDLASAGPAELVSHLAHPNGWWRATAQRLLVERGDAGSVPLLEGALRDSREPLARLHALWTLSGLGALSTRTLLAAFDDGDAAVRSAAARLAGAVLSRREAPPREEVRALSEKLAALAGDPDAKTRFQAALSLGAVEPPARLPALLKIALADAADPWTGTAVLTSLGGEEPLALLPEIIRRAAADPAPRELVRRLSALTGARNRPKEVLACLSILTAGFEVQREPWQIPAVAALLGALGPGGIEKAMGGAPGTEPGTPPLEALQKDLAALFETVAKRAADDALALADRVAAADLLGFDSSRHALPILTGLLEPRFPVDLQKKAVESLARLAAPDARREVTALLLGSFDRLSPRVQSEVLEALLADAGRVSALLAALEKGEVRANQVDLNHRKRLLESEAPEVRARASKVFAELLSNPDRAAVVASYQQALSGGKLEAGDPRKGEPLFLKHCSTCHRAGDRGSAVGADLSGMKIRTPDALLVDILDPSRAVAPEFISYAVVLKDRRVLDGILVSETPSSITLRRAEAKTDSILRRDVAELRSTNLSLMPEGLEKELSPPDLADVIAFVRGGLVSTGAADGAGGTAGAAAGTPGTPGAAATAGAAASSVPASLREALAFHAPFDGGPDAAFARGDRRIYTAPELYRTAEARAGLEGSSVSIAKGKGRHGDALRFGAKEKRAVFFRAAKNVGYRASDWGGTISCWLSLDPDRDLETGFADPIQITAREWNDAALFVDFSKDDRPRHFRLGVFADRAVWDPKRREWDQVPPSERPMVEVPRKVFASGRWTHVAVVFSGFNTGKDDGTAQLYLDGKLEGTLSARRQTFTWDPEGAAIWLGLSYLGLLDDLAIFDRALTAGEVRTLSEN